MDKHDLAKYFFIIFQVLRNSNQFTFQLVFLNVYTSLMLKTISQANRA